MKKIISAGGIVVHKNLILLIQLESGRFAIPKGHIESGETYEEAAIREVGEETAILPMIVKYLGDVTRLSEEKTGEVVEKTIKIYLLRKVSELKITPDEVEVWTTAQEALHNMHFPEEARFIKKHLEDLN